MQYNQGASKDGRIWLSHTGIEALERCPRCFWLQFKKGIRQPEGIVSRLANRFDVVLKNYFSAFRPQLPPMIEEKLEGKLQSPFQEKYYVRINESYGFWGKLDECLVNDKGEHIPLDFKTSSTDPRDKEVLEAYKSQVDAYVFLLKQNQKTVAGFGYLMYVFLEQGEKLHEKFPLIIHLEKLQGHPEKTAERITRAIDILESAVPSPSPDCNFCRYRDAVKEAISE